MARKKRKVRWEGDPKRHMVSGDLSLSSDALKVALPAFAAALLLLRLAAAAGSFCSSLRFFSAVNLRQCATGRQAARGTLNPGPAVPRPRATPQSPLRRRCQPTGLSVYIY